MLLNCYAGEDSWEFLGLQGDHSVNPKENQSWVLIGRTDAETEAPIFWPPDAKSCSFEKTLMLGKIEGKRRRGAQRMRWLDGITDSMDIGLGELQELVMDRVAWHAAFHWVTKHQTWLSNWLCQYINDNSKAAVNCTQYPLLNLGIWFSIPCTCRLVSKKKQSLSQQGTLNKISIPSIFESGVYLSYRKA